MDFTQEYRIRSSWQVRCAAGDPFAVVRVRNIQALVQGPHDAWGRGNKPQPFLVSAELSFTSPFDASVAGDNVTSGDTVHYGNLSKAILASLESFNPYKAVPAENQGALGSATGTLKEVLERIWSTLTGLTVDGITSKDIQKSFLDLSRLRFLSITACLPKASLLGEAVSLTASSLFEKKGSSSQVEMFAISLRLHRLRVPTLIGVNSNERQAKQFVVTDIEIDKFDYAPDVYTTLEHLVVEAMEESSFETLEALGSHLSSRIVRDFRPLPGQQYSGYFGWQVKISMEKPTAVPFADGPVVEVRAGAGLEVPEN